MEAVRRLFAVLAVVVLSLAGVACEASVDENGAGVQVEGGEGEGGEGGEGEGD